ncbi:hypothetical protein BSPWISOXPB_4766 [uncultured Gammaproteobacteria bacterium]|nr:hypothetical protein BSPWISOXPB_4766 [uncultured Gammaproteobacteria bacterium]
MIRQNPIFAQLVISLNLFLAGLRLGLKNRQVGEKWVSDDCSYLCKGLSYYYSQMIYLCKQMPPQLLWHSTTVLIKMYPIVLIVKKPKHTR